jgi:glycosyltransferase involved in cell wall biosynthesis
MVCLDTGSSDGTPEIARALGCKVTEVGERFITSIGYVAKSINEKFIDENEETILKEGDRLFDYAAARNYAASLASNDFVAMPDCDEVYTHFNIDKIDAVIEAGADQLEYNFVFAHDGFGAEIIKFMHSKMYNRKKLKWVGIVHEVLQAI